MPRPILHTGTDLEQLGRQLACNLEKHPPTDPFLQDIILVDGKAISNWLTHAILGSAGLSVHMNAQLMNTRRFGSWAASILEDLPEARGNALNSLPARIYRLLGTGTHLESWRKWSGITDSALEGPKQAEAEVVRWGLAFRLSRHFQDLIRNDAAWITRAEKGGTAGPDDRWSPLWCSAASEIRTEAENRMIHDVDVLEALTNDPKASAHRRKLAEAIPGRLTLFATGDVSATLLRILSVLSEVTSVAIYQLQPTEGLHERMTTREILNSLGTDQEDIELTNPALSLLVSAGRYYRLQFEKFQDRLGSCKTEEIAAAESDGTRLAELKRALRIIATGEEFISAPLAETAEHPSISIHRCHGPLREAEVLRDQLLAAMQQDPTLRQGDMLILTPSPETYAPLLRAVLGSRQPAFDVGTANIYGASSSSFGSLVKTLVELPGGRITAGEIHTMLSTRALQDRLEWGADDLETVQSWMEEAPFYWGFDKEHRQKFRAKSVDDPAQSEDMVSSFDPTDIGTLIDFRKRLAFGTALSHRVIQTGDTMPMPGITGREGLDLAKDLGDVLDPLIAWIETAQDPKSLAEWVDEFRKATTLLPGGKDYVRQNKELGQALERLKQQGKAMSDASAGLADSVSHALFCQMLLDQCDFEAGSGQFMSGRITLAPLRATSIHPAKVVAFIGMSDGAYPIKARGMGPEIAQEKKVKGKSAVPLLAALGSSCQEDTSMHAFMLGLLAAKQRVIATFDGYAGSTGKKASAALPVEILRRACVKLGPGFAVNYHALADYQAPRGSKELAKETPTPATHDKHAGKVFTALKAGERDSAIEPETGGLITELSLQDWAELWTNPLTSALSQLGIRPPRKKTSLDNSEPLEANASVIYTANDWVRRWRDDVTPGQPRRGIPTTPTDIHALAKSIESLREKSGVFPAGDQGQLLLEQLLAVQAALEIEGLAEQPLKDALGTTKPASAHLISSIKLPRMQAYENQDYKSPDSEARGTLVLTVEDTPDWDDCLTGLAILCKYEQEGIKYRKVTVIGTKKPDEDATVESLLKLTKREVEVTDIGVARLRKGFDELAASPLAGNRPLVLNLLKVAFTNHIPNVDTKKNTKIGRDLRMEDLMPSKHNPHKHEQRLVMPERFDLEGFNRIVREMFQHDGNVIRLPRPKATPPTEPASAPEPKTKKGKTSK
jgi:exonuclease V gamma subunit